LGPPLLEELAARRVPVVYDFDDAIFLGHTSAANRAVAPWKRPDKVGAIVARATTTIVGNSWLASYAHQFSSRVTVIPTTIDVDEYTPGARPAGGAVRVGWSGSRTTSPHLHTIDPALQRILQQPFTELAVIGDPSFRLDGVDQEHVNARAWRRETELDDIRAFDIGIMPLPDDDWSKGKCGLKALQYMALAVAAVSSPVGVNPEIVTHGVNGLLASTPDEWVETVERLAQDAELRRELGDAGRQTVLERYSGQQWAPRFLEVLEEAASSRG
jgi:glycosyltransferase involved in cell wall biosynthesis